VGKNQISVPANTRFLDKKGKANIRLSWANISFSVQAKVAATAHHPLLITSCGYETRVQRNLVRNPFLKTLKRKKIPEHFGQ